MNTRHPFHPHRIAGTALVGLLMLTAAACGEDVAGSEGPAAGDPVAGACLVGATDCDDIPGEAPADEFPVEDARELAHGLLGMNEADLPADVRIGRRGDESMALTADYMPGRMTVELDDTDGSGYRVVLVTVELPEGPESFELTPG